jgi:hypothetical protein
MEALPGDLGNLPNLEEELSLCGFGNFNAPPVSLEGHSKFRKLKAQIFYKGSGYPGGIDLSLAAKTLAPVLPGAGCTVKTLRKWRRKSLR